MVWETRQVDPILLIVLGVLLLGALAAVAFLAPSRRGRGASTPSTPAPPAGRTRPDLDDEAAPRAPGRTAAPVPATVAPPGPGVEPDVLVEPGLEVPESAEGRLVRLRARLARSQSTFGRGLLSLLSGSQLDEDTWQRVEETLLAADVGVAPTMELVQRLRTRVRVLGSREPGQVRALLREELVGALQPDLDRSLHVDRSEGRPAVVLVVGVNGTGKTTTVGKLARMLVAADKDVLLGAADTFRAAAADQLATWGERVGVVTIRGPEGGDPASVAYDAVRLGIEQEVDVVLVDTAGRLHTKTGLMDELGKVKRVVEKQAPVDEVLLVIDATTGQNGLVQATVFAEVVEVTGVVLTKLDGTAKGGIVIAVQRALGVPVKLVGLGEGPDDLAPFDPGAFADALLGTDPA